MLHCDKVVTETHAALLLKYGDAYPNLREQHPTYCRGWGVPFMHPHRYMNRIVYEKLLSEQRGTRVLDFGCYDGMLVTMLRRVGVEAYGYEETPWPAMYAALGVENFINRSPVYEDIPPEQAAPAIDVVVALNVLHKWHPREALDRITAVCKSKLPTVIYADREARTPHENNAYWMDDVLIASMGFSVIRFPEYESTGSVDLQRHLLVRDGRKRV